MRTQLVMFALAGWATAQSPYLGGPGDGSASSVLSNRPLDGAVSETLAFLGASGDGHASALLSSSPLNQPSQPLDPLPYVGGNGDGFGTAELASFALSLPSGPSELSPYSAGVSGGDGFATQTVANFALGDTVLSTLAFLGGNGDGFDASALSNWQMEIRLGSPATYATWQNVRFTPAQITAGLAAPDADADGDGLENLIEFVLGTDLLDGSKTAVIHTTLASPSDFGGVPDGNDYLILDFPVSPFALGIVKEVQFSNILEASGWGSVGNVTLVNQANRLVVRDAMPVGSNPTRFGRLSVRLAP